MSNLFPEAFPRTYLLEVSLFVAKVGEEIQPEPGQPSELAPAAGTSSWPMDDPACTAVKTFSVFTASESERKELVFTGREKC